MVADITAMMSNLSNPDKDHRYMATSDLLAALQNPDWKQAGYSDDSSQVCEKVVKQLDDSSGDISALAVKCLVALGHKVSAGHIGKMLELMCNKLVAPRNKKDHSDSTFIGLKAFLSEVPAVHGQLVASTTTPILGTGIKEQGESEALAADCLDLLSTVFTRFGEHVKDRWNVTQTLLSTMAKGTHATSRKAVLCIPALAVHLDEAALGDLMTELVGHVKAAATGAAAQTCMQAVAACAKALGFRFGPYIGTVLPMVTERCRAASATVDADSGLGVEEKEAALHATTALVQFCSDVVKPHVAEVTALALSEISFDPNLADGGDDDMDDGSGADFDDYDDDFSDGDGYGDEEDMSWKVRRAACQLIVALVAAFPDLAPQLYAEARPVLLRRFSEREESVRLDVFAALSTLVRQRGASAADGERADLAVDAEKDILALMKQLRNTRNPKLRGAVFGAVCALLEVASAAGVHGKKAVPLAQSALEDSTAPNALKIEVLRFLRLAFCAEAAADLLPSLPPLVPVLKRSLEDRYYKVVSEAVAVVENAAVMAAAGGGGDPAVMRDLLQAVLGLLRAKDVDQEVKECSIKCVAAMLSLLPASLGAATDTAMPLLCDKLQSDGTRFVAVVACGTIAGAQPPLPLGAYVLPLITAMTPLLRKAQRSAAECVAALSEGSPDRVAETMRLCIQSLEQASSAEAEQCLLLLLLGELGRVSDLSAFPEVERLVVGALAAGSEDVKATASLALGGVAVGNVHRYLPLLLSRAAEVDRASPKQLYLLLKSLNEVLRTLLAKSSQMQPEQQEQVLQLLGSNMEAEEECRSVVADCLAQLAFMSPAALASWLLQQLSSESAGARGVAVAAMKYALNDSAHDASHLTQHLPMFLQRLEDPDHGVRREAVQLFNAAALTRPALTAPCIAAALPLLLQLTVVDEKLVRVVELGPFKQKVDDGLSLRKHTLECVETLLSRPVYHDKLDMGPIAAGVARTLGDDKAIKPVAHALLCRLCKLAPAAVLSHLESMITPLQKTLNEKLKDDAIPQERERHIEKIKSTLTAVKAIADVPQATTMVPAFRHFLLKPELLNAVADAGFEHPSEVQQECLPQAILGTDIICQAKSGMGKTAVFVLAVLQQLVPTDGEIDTLVLCHTRELAYQICQEFERFSKYLEVNVAVVFGGVPFREHQKLLATDKPHVVVATPGRMLALIRDKAIDLSHLKRFILDECDNMLEQLDMRRDVQQIFRATPHEKQVMMFSATLAKDVRPVCKKFTQHPIEIYVDDESKLTLHGLQQYYCELKENQKNRKLTDLLDALEFNQVVIFVNSVRRAQELNKLLVECNFPSMCMYGRMDQTERIERYNRFKEFKSRILVSTDIFGRGVDFERVNIVINYDMPQSEQGETVAADTYLHRVGRSGRFGTKGLAVTFVSSEQDRAVLETIQKRFIVSITPLPDEIDTATYMTS